MIVYLRVKNRFKVYFGAAEIRIVLIKSDKNLIDKILHFSCQKILKIGIGAFNLKFSQILSIILEFPKTFLFLKNLGIKENLLVRKLGEKFCKK
jgi:hypothetical protein